jgi:uncharacterized protein (DUF488 family)
VPDCSVFSVGHSTRAFVEFVSLLRGHGIEVLADVRTVPRSRRNPQFNAESLAHDLPAAGITYIELPELGGWRRPHANSPNGGWRHASFRGYADYMSTDEFLHALDVLMALGRERPLAFMCAEAVPWRCHRSLIADALAVRDWQVCHIITATKTSPHRMTSFALVDGTVVTYPPAIEGA